MPRTKSDLSKEKFINSLRKNEISRNEAIVVLNKIIAEADRHYINLRK